jgi:CubicO group peptidase (beta-lactamase class C family)
VNSLPRAQAVLQRGLEDRTYSAVTAEIGGGAGPLWGFAAGRLAFDSPSPVDPETVFDLASLTKVLATATIALLLVRRDVLRVDQRISDVVPEWSAGDRVMLTIRDLLEHSSGLPAHRDYFRRLTGLAAYVGAIAQEPLEYPPRTRAIYSDLGFIVLGAVLERLGGTSLAEQFDAWKMQANISGPLAYLPPADWQRVTAVTVHDPWRGRTLQGEVHDENAAALGGVAPHAGVFGTAAAVGAAARWWLRELASGDARQFAARSAVPGSSRALGWDTMLAASSCGQLMSDSAIGHTGFTGTSLWLDPARDRYFVLLSNRVHAGRTSDAIQRLRRDFHDAANQDLS